MTKEQYLALKRAERLQKLTGKFVVISDNSRIEGSVLYYQDTTLTRHQNPTAWTRFMVNAKPFDSFEEAKSVAARFQFGNPRVCQIS